MVERPAKLAKQVMLRIQGLISGRWRKRWKSVIRDLWSRSTSVWYSNGVAMAAMRRQVVANARRSLWPTSQSVHWWSTSRNSHVPVDRRANRVVNGGLGTKKAAMGYKSSVGSCSNEKCWGVGVDHDGGAGAAGTGNGVPTTADGEAIQARCWSNPTHSAQCVSWLV